MTLTFLGQPYETTSTTIAPTTSGATGRYRGTPVHFSTSRPMPASNVTLTYRGVHYTR